LWETIRKSVLVFYLRKKDMEIENQKIRIKINNFNKKHLQSIGYHIETLKYIEIYVKELSRGSGLKINVVCNFCGKVFKKSYRRYLETRENLCCNECKEIKMMETSLKKYGNICSLRNEKILAKSKKNQY
jgi:hypothetical protein